MDALIKAEQYSHGVRLTGFNREMFQRLTAFLEGLTLKEPKKNPHGYMTMELKKKYYGITADYREITIHRNTLPELMSYLDQRNIHPTRIDHTRIEAPVSAVAEYVVLEQYVARDYQEIIIRELTDALYSRRLDLQTGKGKTFCALAALAILKCKAVIMVAPKYFGIWEKALKETYKDIEGRYVRVEGGDEIKTLIRRGMNDDLKEFDIFLVSNVSYRNYIEAYETHGAEGIELLGYDVPPQRFHEVIGAGCQINDEYQDDPALTYRIDMFTNVAKQIFLSATPFTGDPYVTKMIDVGLPFDTRCTLPAFDAFIDVQALMYTDHCKPQDYLAPYKNTYNHARYETQMLKKPTRLAIYQGMIKRVANGIFFRDALKGQKLLVLCATVLFIESMTKYLKKEFPDWTIDKHVAGCDAKKLQTNDVTVSTAKSAGTGQDIIDLRETLLLLNTGSKKDALQILGRTRPLKHFPQAQPRLTYLFCANIQHHLKYHEAHKEHFEGKVKSHRTMRLG